LTIEKVEAAKNFIEQRYSKMLYQEKQKKEYWEMLNKKMESLGLSNAQQTQIKNDVTHEEAKILREERKKLTIYDFKSLKVIGKGAFGEVRLCRWLKTGEPVAIKKLKKS
jgi:serine/threonine kinase 38